MGETIDLPMDERFTVPLNFLRIEAIMDAVSPKDKPAAHRARQGLLLTVPPAVLQAESLSMIQIQLSGYEVRLEGMPKTVWESSYALALVSRVQGRWQSESSGHSGRR
jgi:hypothetical protein